MSTEAEFASVLDEMDARVEWARLDRELQLSWLHWMERSGETPRVRMYQAVNFLREGKTQPPRFATARAWLSAYLSLPWW